MLFNSFEYIFFLITAFVFCHVFYRRFRWALLLILSYVFYSFWNPKYTLLIFITTVTTYIAGLFLAKSRSVAVRKLLLAGALAINLGILVLFKYFNLLAETFNKLSLGHVEPLDLLLPIGISFYTFQTIGYMIDVYRNRITAERHLGYFALYVSFFPQLVAGPIERADNLLPQLKAPNQFSTTLIRQGLIFLLIGYFKKVVIADRLAIFVDLVYQNPAAVEPSLMLVATYFFAFQIYFDFAGYTDIAIGSAKLLGIDLMQNFDRPYFSLNVQQFWRRWHISLSSWFRDYLYIPLGGNRHGNLRQGFNILIVFALCGLWHGANWTFAAWGTAHGVLLCAQLMFNNIFPSGATRLHGPIWSFASKALRMFLTFNAVTLAWVFFRSRNIAEAWDTLARICSPAVFTSFKMPLFLSSYEVTLSIVFIGLMMVYEALAKGKSSPEVFQAIPTLLRWPAYYGLFFAIIIFGMFNLQEFIYFQF